MPPATFTAEDIEVRELNEHVRLRPDLYLGDVGPDGLLRLVLDAVDAAFDQALEGAAARIDVRIRADGSVVVDHDGEGLPADRPLSSGASLLVHILTAVSGCWCGCGLLVGHVRQTGRALGPAIVGPLCSDLRLETHADGRRWRVRCTEGRPGRVREAGPSGRRGTRLHLVPDRAIFGRARLDGGRLLEGIRWRSALTPEVTWTFADARTAGARVLLRSPRGLSDLVHFLAVRPRLQVPIATRTWPAEDGVSVALALTRQAGRGGRLLGFVNGAEVPAGDHVEALTRGLSAGLAASGRPRRRPLDGIVAAVAVTAARAATTGAGAATRLDAPEVRPLVEATAAGIVRRWVFANPALARSLLA